MPKAKSKRKKPLNGSVKKEIRRGKPLRNELKSKPRGPDALTLALYLISFILVVFGAWYHKISWLLLGFVPFLVALWYEYMKHRAL